MRLLTGFQFAQGFMYRNRCHAPFNSNLTCTKTQPRTIWQCVAGREIVLSAIDGTQVSAWTVTPSTEEKSSNGRGVVLLTDVLGYENPETRMFAATFSEFGISVIVPDLFRGSPWREAWPAEEYETWRASHPTDVIMSDVRLSVAELRRQGLSVGMLGFCFGGGLVMDELARGKEGIDPEAAVVFYPTRFLAFEAGRLARCPLMAVFGDKDEWIPMQVVEDLQKGLEENEEMEECEVLLYEGASHGFAHHPRSAQDEDDSEILKYQSVEWFTKFLKGTPAGVASQITS